MFFHSWSIFYIPYFIIFLPFQKLPLTILLVRSTNKKKFLIFIYIRMISSYFQRKTFTGYIILGLKLFSFSAEKMLCNSTWTSWFLTLYLLFFEFFFLCMYCILSLWFLSRLIFSYFTVSVLCLWCDFMWIYLGLSYLGFS